MCFSSFMRDMKVFMVHHPDQGKWQPHSLGGVHPNSTARTVRRQRPKLRSPRGSASNR